MAEQGGVIENKKIGIDITTDGTFNNTKLVNGKITLAERSFNPIMYFKEGTWTSKVIDIGDNFASYEKIVATIVNNGDSRVEFYTRTSSDGVVFEQWTKTSQDSSILSKKNRYIQLRMNLYAGDVEEVVEITALSLSNNEFVESVVYKTGVNIVPVLTSNTSSPLGTAFAETSFSTSYLPWRAFGNLTANESYATANGRRDGKIGFAFKDTPQPIKSYSVKSMGALTYIKGMPKDWVFQGSNDTTTGLDGTWTDLDTRTNQSWDAIYQRKVYQLEKTVQFKAYRIFFSTNNDYGYTGIGALEFITEEKNNILLKRDYNYDMVQDSTWTDTGDLHRKTITRSEWLKIDRLDVR